MKNVFLIVLLATMFTAQAQQIFSGAGYVITKGGQPSATFEDVSIYAVNQANVFVEWSGRKFSFPPLEEMSRYTANGEKTIFRSKNGDAALYVTLDSFGGVAFINFNVLDREGNYVDRLQWFPNCEVYLTRNNAGLPNY